MKFVVSLTSKKTEESSGGEECLCVEFALKDSIYLESYTDEFSKTILADNLSFQYVPELNKYLVKESASGILSVATKINNELSLASPIAVYDTNNNGEDLLNNRPNLENQIVRSINTIEGPGDYLNKAWEVSSDRFKTGYVVDSWTGTWSASCWVKTDTLQENTAILNTADLEFPDTPSLNLSFYGPATTSFQRPRLFLRHGTAGDVLGSGTTPQYGGDGIWHHYTVTCNSGILNLYIDGIASDTLDITPYTQETESGGLIFCDSSIATQSDLEGGFCCPIIFSEELSAAQALTLYQIMSTQYLEDI